jgi:hypothetical protein
MLWFSYPGNDQMLHFPIILSLFFPQKILPDFMFGE